MKILVIGHKGMLGHAIMGEFNHMNTIGLDRDDVDITDKEAVLSEIAKIKPQIVINCAAYTNADTAEEESEKAFAVNSRGVANLAQAASHTGAVFIHYSTDYVFDGKKKEGYGESDMPHNPVNTYGASKLAGEEKILKLKTKNSKFHYYLIRTSWLFGPNGKNFVQTIINLARRGKHLRVVNDQWGKPTYTIDLAKATRELIKSQSSSGIYHLVNEPETSWYAFAKEIVHLVPNVHTKVIPVSSEEFPRPARRPHYSMLLNTKRPLLRPWRQALKDYMGASGLEPETFSTSKKRSAN